MSDFANNVISQQHQSPCYMYLKSWLLKPWKKTCQAYNTQLVSITYTYTCHIFLYSCLKIHTLKTTYKDVSD